MQTVVGYSWSAGSSKQVAYLGQDFHVHELSVTVDGGWVHADLTARCAGAHSVGDNMPANIVAFAWEANRSKHVLYVDNLSHVHQLAVTPDSPWQHTDITLDGGTAVWADALSGGFAWDTGAHFLDVPASTVIDGYRFAIGGGHWLGNPILPAGGKPPRSFPTFSMRWAELSGYGWDEGGTQQVTYVGTDSHVQELLARAGGDWTPSDLTSLSGAPTDPAHLPALVSGIQGYQWAGGHSKQVAFVGEDGHVHELTASPNWGYADLSATARDVRTGAAGAPPVHGAGIAAYAWEEGGSKQVVYVTDDGHVHELFTAADGRWMHADLTAIAVDLDGTGVPPAALSPAPAISGYAWPAGHSKQVVYLTADGHLHELSVSPNSRWTHADLTARARDADTGAVGAPPARST